MTDRSASNQYRADYELYEELRNAGPERRERRLDELRATDPHRARAMDEMLKQPFELDDHEYEYDNRNRNIADDKGPSGALTGKTIDEFEIGGLIGSGGFADVYEARQRHPDRQVAIKILRLNDTRSDRRIAQRFQHESQILASLHHPGIAQVFRTSSHPANQDAPPFYAMELIPNALSLTDFAGRHDLSLLERVQLLIGVCEAVSYGHDRGVIHRDLKPSNVVLDEQGHVKVIDFGIARVTNPEIVQNAESTVGGGLLGTIRYMSPEQVSEGAQDLDVRTDVYSLGVLAYELCSGQFPYELDETTLYHAMKQIQESIPPALDLKAGRFGKRVNAVILKALEKQPAHRYRSVRAFTDDLGNALEGRPVSAERRTIASRVANWTLAHQKTAAFLSVMLVVGLGLLISWAGIYYFGLQPHHIMLDESRRRVTLKSRGDLTLAEWDGGFNRAIRFARLLYRPRGMGGGRLCVIGYESFGSDRLPHAGAVEVYDIRSPHQPIWSTQHGDEVPPNGYRKETHVKILQCVVQDVWEDLPGDEIIVIQQFHPYSTRLIRCFDLTGKCHFLVWADGGARRAVWLRATQELVLVGKAEWRWTHWGIDIDDYPFLVQAIRVERGYIDRTNWLRREDGTLAPIVEWCRWLGPIEPLSMLAKHRMEIAFQSPGWGFDEDSEFSVSIRRETDEIGGRPSIAFVMSAEGEVIHRWTDDQYPESVKKIELPDPELLEWLDYSEMPIRPDHDWRQ